MTACEGVNQCYSRSGCKFTSFFLSSSCLFLSFPPRTLTNDTSARATTIGRKSSLAIFTSTFKTQFTSRWQSSDDLRSKLKSELIKSSRNAPCTKSTDGSRDVKCTKVALVSVTCQFKPIGSLRSSGNAGNSKINSSRAGSLFLAPFFSPALGRGSPSKRVSLLAG